VKIRILILLAVCFLFQTFAQRDPKSYSLEKAFNIAVRLSSKTRQVLRLKFDGKNPKLELLFGNKTQSFTFDDFMLEPDSHGSVLVDDFNFDGFIDIGIPTGTGYGGVNYFYNFYTFERSSQSFKIMPEPKPIGGDWCNPQLDTRNKTIFTNCKSGPKWYSANYRFYQAKPYLYQSGEMVLLDGFPDDKNESFLLWRETTYHHNKRELGSRLYDYNTTKTPIRRIPQAKVFLYNAPKESEITRNYIVKNDRVWILELKDSDRVQWLKIAYHSRKLGWIKRWIRLGQ
jgi:hypothetical protein